jgi:hypothetical protein
MPLSIDPATRQLPPGRHRATWDEVERLFVHEAPHRDSREVTYRVLREWAHACWCLLPSARFWIDGGFVTHKDEAPLDADVVAVVPISELQALDERLRHELHAAEIDSASKCQTVVRFWALWSLQGVEAGSPVMSLQKLQPFGGHVDAFYVVEENVAGLQYWHDWWSQGAGDTLKGYVEVTA